MTDNYNIAAVPADQLKELENEMMTKAASAIRQGGITFMTGLTSAAVTSSSWDTGVKMFVVLGVILIGALLVFAAKESE